MAIVRITQDPNGYQSVYVDGHRVPGVVSVSLEARAGVFPHVEIRVRADSLEVDAAVASVETKAE